MSENTFFLCNDDDEESCFDEGAWQFVELSGYSLGEAGYFFCYSFFLYYSSDSRRLSKNPLSLAVAFMGDW